jgi:hypothetical protein
VSHVTRAKSHDEFADGVADHFECSDSLSSRSPFVLAELDYLLATRQRASRRQRFTDPLPVGLCAGIEQ